MWTVLFAKSQVMGRRSPDKRMKVVNKRIKTTLCPVISACGLLLALSIPSLLGKEPDVGDIYDRSRVGPLADGRVIVPTNHILSPAGRQVVVDGRPTDVALSP